VSKKPMKTSPINPGQSERGVALIIVLLLLAVMTGLATGMTVNSQVEIAMASNESTYAGARAAAEAGLNRAVRAILDDSATNLLAGQDGVAGNADDGDIGFLMADFTGWPEPLGTAGQYSYTVEILDDDDAQLYAEPLDEDQWLVMLEDGDPASNLNDRLVIRATGFGPKGTTVRVAKILSSVDSTSPGSTTPSFSNPAIIVNGDLTMSGNFSIGGTQGNVHSNGNLVISGGSGDVSGDITAVGTLTAADGIAGGTQSGGAATINVPEVDALDYLDEANYILNANGTKTLANGAACNAACVSASNGWSWSLANGWRITGSTAPTGTFFVYGSVSISGSPGSAKTPAPLAVIATGSISVTGHPYLTLPPPVDPSNPSYLQFVTNGDLKLAGAADIDDVTLVEGRTLVREQLHISGNPELQGQIIVENVESVSSLVTDNTISGNPDITYNGSFAPINTPIFTPGVTSYLNNVSGWLES